MDETINFFFLSKIFNVKKIFVMIGSVIFHCLAFSAKSYICWLGGHIWNYESAEDFKLVNGLIILK